MGLFQVHVSFRPPQEIEANWGMGGQSIVGLLSRDYSIYLTHPYQEYMYIKEGKRVSNALYAPCNMFSESHAP